MHPRHLLQAGDGSRTESEGSRDETGRGSLLLGDGEDILESGWNVGGM